MLTASSCHEDCRQEKVKNKGCFYKLMCSSSPGLMKCTEGDLEVPPGREFSLGKKYAQNQTEKIIDLLGNRVQNDPDRLDGV